MRLGRCAAEVVPTEIQLFVGYGRNGKSFIAAIMTRGCFVIAAATPLFGCGGSNKTAAPQTYAVSIVSQPASTTVPLNSTTTLSVTATGTPPLNYQWSRNGVSIAGATRATYTTPPVEMNDNGASFTVVVSNSINSLSSDPATITVGPRAPAAGDLRFQQVDASAAEDAWAGESFTYLLYPFGHTYQNVLGSPLRMGGVEGGWCVAGVAQDCIWAYSLVPAPSGLTLGAGYLPDALEKLDADLSFYTDASSVVTSWDIEAGNDVFGMAWMKGSATGFDCRHEIVPASGLQELVANDGTNSRVVTAISFDGSGQVHLLSYGWASDRATVYDTAVAGATYDTVPEQATSLANAGYIITAFGGNQTDGYVMVGTKVHGDSIPRPVLTFPPAASGTSVKGYAMVGQAGNAANPTVLALWIFEK